jgi:Asp/Glu/hydantoin racemase
MAIIRGGRTVYGQALGVLMLDTRFPRPLGDVGNAQTWPFPVQYRIVRGADTSRIMGAKPDQSLLEPLLDAARELEAMGVRAITTSCGFFAVFQRELAAAVSIPVVASSLLQVPIAARMLRPDQRVAVLTERPHLTENHFLAVGWSPADVPVVITAMPPESVFPTVFIDNPLEADLEVLEAEMVAFARRTVADHPDVGALVLECTNFVPFSQAMRRAVGLPVFDLHTLVTQTVLATTGHEFVGEPGLR